jgi:hypothetical protein
VRYSDLAIFATMLNRFLISLCRVVVTQPFYDLSVILEIWSAIFLISSDILEISLKERNL